MNDKEFDARAGDNAGVEARRPAQPRLEPAEAEKRSMDDEEFGRRAGHGAGVEPPRADVAGQSPLTAVILVTPDPQELDELFSAITPQLDTIFVVTFPLDVHAHDAPLELPSMCGGMPVNIAVPGTAFVPGAIHVIPPGKPITAPGGVLEPLSSDCDERAPARALLVSRVVDRDRRGIVVRLTSMDELKSSFEELPSMSELLQRSNEEDLANEELELFTQERDAGIQLAREQALSREQQQTMVAELGLKALEALDLDDFLGTGLSLLPEAAGVDAAEVLRLEGDALKVVRRIGFATNEAAAETISPADAIPGDGHVLLLDDTSDETPWSEVLRQEGFASGTRLSISSPEGRPYGVLAVYTRQRRLLSPQDLTFLRSIANVFASAVQRQIIEETRLRDRELETLQRSEAQLRRAERLASLGTFATGIAHELNNPLNNIALSAETMESDGDPARRARLLEHVRSNAERCGRIIESVLRFARNESTRKWPIDLNALVQHATGLVRADFGPNRLQFQLLLDASLPPVRCNPTEMEQVFTNLIRNAAQAHTDLCTVTIATKSIPAGVRIVVGDDGRGIAEKDLPHIFDPFFSTRRRDGGTGLGLSITQRIVNAHAGTIRASNDEKAGAKFVIELPLDLGEDSQGEGNGEGSAD